MKFLPNNTENQMNIALNIKHNHTDILKNMNNYIHIKTFTSHVQFKNIIYVFNHKFTLFWKYLLENHQQHENTHAFTSEKYIFSKICVKL